MDKKHIHYSKSHDDLHRLANSEGDPSGGANILRKMYERQKSLLSRASQFDQSDTNVDFDSKNMPESSQSDMIVDESSNSDKSTMNLYEARQWLKNSKSSQDWESRINKSNDLRTTLEIQAAENKIPTSLLGQTAYRWLEVPRLDDIEIKIYRTLWPKAYTLYDTNFQCGEKRHEQLMDLSKIKTLCQDLMKSQIKDPNLRQQIKDLRQQMEDKHVSVLDLGNINLQLRVYLRLNSTIEKAIDDQIQSIEICEAIYRDQNMKQRLEKLHQLPQEIVDYCKISEGIQNVVNEFAETLDTNKQEMFHTSVDGKDILRRVRAGATEYLNNLEDHWQTVLKTWEWIKQHRNRIPQIPENDPEIMSDLLDRYKKELHQWKDTIQKVIDDTTVHPRSSYALMLTIGGVTSDNRDPVRDFRYCINRTTSNLRKFVESVDMDDLLRLQS